MKADSCGGRIVRPSKIPGVRINPNRAIERMEGRNALIIRKRCGAVHVWTPPMQAVREVIGKAKWRPFPPAFKRGLIHCILKTHAANLKEFRVVMGHNPAPSKAMVTAAMLGDTASRRRILSNQNATRPN